MLQLHVEELLLHKIYLIYMFNGWTVLNNRVAMDNLKEVATTRQLPLVVEGMVPLHPINSSSNNPHQGMVSLHPSMVEEAINKGVTSNHPKGATSNLDMEEDMEGELLPKDMGAQEEHLLGAMGALVLVDHQEGMVHPHPQESVRKSGKCFRFADMLMLIISANE